MVKAIADVEGCAIGQEIGNSESCRQDEVEPAGLFRDLACEIGPKGASGEFGVGSNPVQRDEAVFDFRGEPEAVREKRFLKLDIDHFGPDRDLSAIPTVFHRIGDGHHPRGHEGRALLLGCVVLCKAMGKKIAGAETDFLRTDGNPGRDIRGM